LEGKKIAKHERDEKTNVFIFQKKKNEEKGRSMAE
jgi:hypothetical protein